MNTIKKGFFLNLVEIFGLIFLLISVIVIIVYLTTSFVHFSADSFDSDASQLAYAVIYSPEGISYHDKNLDRLEPGLVDIQKVTSKDYNKALNDAFMLAGENTWMGARVTIYDSSGKFSQTAHVNPPPSKILNNVISFGTPFDLFIQEPVVLFLNEDYFKRWSVLSKLGYDGPGGYRQREYYYTVNTLHEDGMIYNGVVRVEVVGRNA